MMTTKNELVLEDNLDPEVEEILNELKVLFDRSNERMTQLTKALEDGSGKNPERDKEHEEDEQKRITALQRLREYKKNKV